MSGSRRIIVGTSGAPGSLPALRYAAELARQDDATLIPVLAWLPPGGDMADRRCPSSHLRQIWKDAAWLRLWAALDSAWGGIAPAGRPAEPLVRRGEPGEVLVAAASQPGDLLVVGAGRRGLAWRLLRGRVARYCLAHAAARWWPYHPRAWTRRPVTGCAAGPSGTGLSIQPASPPPDPAGQPGTQPRS